MNPPLVLGPILPYLQTLDNLNTSNQRVATIMTGKATEAIPPTGTFIWVDVRDLALAHVKAIESPTAEAAAGKRFFVTAGYFSNEEIADIVRDNFPAYKDKLPVKGTKGGEYPEGGVYKYDNGRSMEVLGLKYRDLKECIIDTAKSLQLVGA